MLTSLALPLAAMIIAAIISAIGTWLIRRWAVARDFVDRPGGHKGHAIPVALGGGVAITCGAIIPLIAVAIVVRTMPHGLTALFPSLSIHLGGIVAKTPIALAIAGAALVMCVVGLMDDRRPLGAGVRFIVQGLVAGVLVFVFDLRLLSHLPEALSGALSVLWIMLLTNSFNFLDNMDGLAAGVATIASLIFAAASFLAGQVFVPTACCLLAGALLGFLPFNFHPARIYMGDAGSTVIGMLLAVFTILTTFADPAQQRQPTGVIAPLIVMAVPLYDTMSVFFLRWRLGIPIWHGDRRHFSHRLVRRGLDVRSAVIVIWLATLVTSLPALLLPLVSWVVAWGILIQTGLVVLLVALLESSGKNESA